MPDNSVALPPEVERILPWLLSWPGVDPARHPFAPERALAVVRGLPLAAAVPTYRATRLVLVS